MIILCIFQNSYRNNCYIKNLRQNYKEHCWLIWENRKEISRSNSLHPMTVGKGKKKRAKHTIINHWTQYFDVWIQNGYDRSIVLPTKWFCNKVPLSTVLSSSCFFFLQLIIHLYDRFCSFFRSLLFSLLRPHHFSFRLTFVRWTSGSRPRSILAEITTLCRAW